MRNVYSTFYACILTLCFMLSVPSYSQTTIIPYNSTWKYLDNNTRPANWQTSAFADASWSSGTGQFGYGDGDEATVVNYGGCTPIATCGPKYITTYFRKTINIADPSVYSGFSLGVKRDDGIVLYVNGAERYADNMPAGRTHATLASTAASDDGATEQTAILPASAFIAGNNVIAVEIHQNSTTSSDISFDMKLIGNPLTPTVVRGPYLQMGNQTSINVRWRSDINSDSKVTYGKVFGVYTNSVSDATLSTEHELTLTGLTADTKYYYTIGSSTFTIEGTANNFFNTLPASSSTRKIKILAFGDCGTASTIQANVRNAFISYANTNNINPDAWLLLGDNGYNAGLDNEYTSNFFNIYSGSLLKNIKLYPAPGNHDYSNSATNQPLRTLPYYQQFTVPANGEIGGIASSTEAYYSYNIENIHFISLDSYGTENASSRLYDTAIGNRQADWLRNDLAANTKKWTVVYFHHPPYTKGSHDSDVETELVNMHNKIPKILERYGVDLVINGHSHSYERSFLVKDIYYNSTSYAPANLVNGSTANYSGNANSCPYTTKSGKNKHGTVYVLSGSSGQLSGTNPGWPLPFMALSTITNAGSFYFEVDSNRLDAKFISYNPTTFVPLVRDSFTIFKDVNNTIDTVVAQNTPLVLTASWRGGYKWPNNGNVTTQAVIVNTSAAGTYDFIVKDPNSCIKDSFHVVVSLILPVTLTYFNATLVTDKVLLSWSTQQEVNNKYFRVEKSYDGVNFQVVAEITGAGNSSSLKNYSVTDASPAEGINYYRLSQVNYDGKSTIYDVRKINYKSLTSFSSRVVNLPDGLVRIYINTVKADRLNIKLTNIPGETLLNETLKASPGNNTKDFHPGSGAYILTITNSSGDKISHKVIVQ